MGCLPEQAQKEAATRRTISSPPLGPTATVDTTIPAATKNVFTLIIRKGNNSVCYGCKGNFAKQPAAPHDLVIQHQDYRMYTLPDGTVKHKYCNMYYQPTLPCICAKQPHFNATQIVVSQLVKNQATPVHRYSCDAWC